MTALTDYDDTFLQCRRGNLGHHWMEVGCFADGGRVMRRLACANCETVRNVLWTPSATIVRSTYRYPDGYKVKGGATALEVRQEVLRRVTVYNNEEQMLAALFGPKQKRVKR